MKFTFRWTNNAGKTTVKEVNVSKTTAIISTVATTVVAIGCIIALGRRA